MTTANDQTAEPAGLPRSAGILLHPTSLPGPHGTGDLGEAAYRFVDFLQEARQTIWQMMPLGPVGLGNSPYSARSAFAGAPAKAERAEYGELPIPTGPSGIICQMLWRADSSRSTKR